MTRKIRPDWALDPRLSVDDIFDYPDDLKLRSCLTLFAFVSEPESVFERLLQRYFAGIRDGLTLTRLQQRGAAQIDLGLGTVGTAASIECSQSSRGSREEVRRAGLEQTSSWGRDAT